MSGKEWFGSCTSQCCSSLGDIVQGRRSMRQALATVETKIRCWSLWMLSFVSAHRLEVSVLAAVTFAWFATPTESIIPPHIRPKRAAFVQNLLEKDIPCYSLSQRRRWDLPKAKCRAIQSLVQRRSSQRAQQRRYRSPAEEKICQPTTSFYPHRMGLIIIIR